MVTRILTGVALLLCAFTAAAAYPDRPIRMVVPAAPGGAVDVFGRIVAHEFAKFIRADVQKYAEIARKANIQPQ